MARKRFWACELGEELNGAFAGWWCLGVRSEVVRGVVENGWRGVILTLLGSLGLGHWGFLLWREGGEVGEDCFWVVVVVGVGGG